MKTHSWGNFNLAGVAKLELGEMLNNSALFDFEVFFFLVLCIASFLIKILRGILSSNRV